MSFLNDMDMLDEEPQIDLTPLIDCLFTLIIFFVLTMSFSKPMIDIILPESRVATEKRVTEQIPLHVKADGTYWMKNAQVTLTDVEASLAKAPKAVLNIHMDEKAPFSAFVAAVDLAKDKHNGQFVISTRKAN